MPTQLKCTGGHLRCALVRAISASRSKVCSRELKVWQDSHFRPRYRGNHLWVSVPSEAWGTPNACDFGIHLGSPSRRLVHSAERHGTTGSCRVLVRKRTYIHVPHYGGQYQVLRILHWQLQPTLQTEVMCNHWQSALIFAVTLSRNICSWRTTSTRAD